MFYQATTEVGVNSTVGNMSKEMEDCNQLAEDTSISLREERKRTHQPGGQ